MRKQIPFYEQLPLFAKKTTKIDTQGQTNHPKSAKLLSSPKLLSKFAPVSSMVKRSPKPDLISKLKDHEAAKGLSILAKLSGPSEEIKTQKTDQEESKIKASKTMIAQHVPWIDPTKAQELALSPNINTEVIRLPNVAKNTSPTQQKSKNVKADVMNSPSIFLRDAVHQANSLNYCECGNVCEGDNTLCASCQKSKSSVEYSGYLYLKTKENKIKRYWYNLLNKELYCMFFINLILGYKNKEDPESKRMHSLAGTFIKEELEEIFDKKTILFPFSLCFLHNKKTLYAIKKDEKVGWVKALKEAIGYSSLYDFYELKVTFYLLYGIGNFRQRKVWTCENGNS